MQKISVIVPVYQAENTIQRCLDSLLCSTYPCYEILAIDDGSKDKSRQILAEYARKNEKVKVIRQKNRGPSAARNQGLSMAKGEIVAFVDSDDYVRADYLEQIAKAFEEKKADVVFFEFCRVTENQEMISRQKLPAWQENYGENIKRLSKEDLFGYTWSKAFRKEAVGAIRFDETISLMEDELFTCAVCKKPLRLFYLREALYFYVRSPQTLTHKVQQKYCKICDQVYQSWKEVDQNVLQDPSFVRQKAAHMAMVCKYYGLEQNVHPIHFFQEMRASRWLQEGEWQDPFLQACKEGRWWKVARYYLIYQGKQRAAGWSRRST